MSKWELDGLVRKVDWEGGIDNAMLYFGREVNSVSAEVNAAWSRAYDAIGELRALLPDVDWSEDDCD